MKLSLTAPSHARSEPLLDRLAALRCIELSTSENMYAIGRLRASLLQGPVCDHQVIRQWAARHSAVPAEITPRKFDGEPAILWFLFDNKGTEEIVQISWEHFFAQFDLLGLHLMFDDSPYFELVYKQKSPEELGQLPA